MRSLIPAMLICLLLFNTLSGPSYAREDNTGDVPTKDIRKNSLYIEIGGNGFLYSLNYDRIIPIRANMGYVENNYDCFGFTAEMVPGSGTGDQSNPGTAGDH